MNRLIGILVAALVVIVGSAWWSRHRGGAESRPDGAREIVVEAIVDLTRPAEGTAAVSLEFPAATLDGRRHVLLGFADAHAGPSVFRSFTAEAGGQAVAVTRETFRGALLMRMEAPRASGPLEIAYTIDPTYYPAGSVRRTAADARSRVTAELAVVRASSLLPVLGLSGASYRVRFLLPDGWTAVTPWEPDGERWRASAEVEAGLEYLAFGPFSVREIVAGENRILLATALVGEVPTLPFEAILRREVELLAAPLRRTGTLTAVVVPESFMRGGAAGRHTIVQAPSPVVLAHEVFHWWNDGTMTAADAGWFREGLTEFYGIRIARETGAWTVEQESGCLADLQMEMRQIEAGAQPRSLVAASLDPAASRLVYSKGAMFWLFADRELRRNGRYLEEAVRRALGGERVGLTTGDLRAIFAEMYGGQLDTAFDRFVLGSEPLPDLGLGPGTGRSGCAPDLAPMPVEMLPFSMPR